GSFSGDMTVTGFTELLGGTQTGFGTLRALGGAQLSGVTIDRHRVELHGNSALTGDINIGYSGALDIVNGAVLGITTEANIGPNANAGVIINAGTLRNTGGSGVSTVR